MASLDLQVRDPKGINSHIEVQFEDVLGEADGIHSYNMVWYIASECFKYSQSCYYKFLTLLFGPCIAMAYGINFACLAFRQVWCGLPCLRSLAITCGCLQACFGHAMNCCVASPATACGWFFSRIRINGDYK